MRSTLTTIIELLGAACIAAAAWLANVQLGLVATGLLLVGLGFLLERD